MSTIARVGVPRPAERAAPLRFITATSPFDGHDRGLEEIVLAVCREDADDLAISSYRAV